MHPPHLESTNEKKKSVIDSIKKSDGKNIELEEKRRREDRERMMRMMAQIFQRPSPYEFNTEEYPYDSHY